METFKIDDRVTLEMTGEQGKIIGKAQYKSHPDSYFVRYVTSDDRQIECWFDGDALK